MTAEKDTRLQVLASHYSETFQLLKTVVEKRDRLFLYILILMFLILLFMSAPSGIGEWLNSFIGSQAGGNNQTTAPNQAPLIDDAFIGSVLLFGLLALSHTYFQTVLHIERQYDYVRKLEDELRKDFNNRVFTREGIHYNDNKKKFSGWTKAIFWYLFPLLFLLFNVFGAYFLCAKYQAPIAYKVIDYLILATMLLSLGFYIQALIFKK